MWNKKVELPKNQEKNQKITESDVTDDFTNEYLNLKKMSQNLTGEQSINLSQNSGSGVQGEPTYFEEPIDPFFSQPHFVGQGMGQQGMEQPFDPNIPPELSEQYINQQNQQNFENGQAQNQPVFDYNEMNEGFVSEVDGYTSYSNELQNKLIKGDPDFNPIYANDNLRTNQKEIIKLLSKALKILESGNSQKYFELINTYLKSLNLKCRSMQKIGFSEASCQNIDCVKISAFEFGEISKRTCNIIITNRGEALSNDISITYFYFGGEQLFIYNYLFDITGNFNCEEVYEVFYRDITSIKIENGVLSFESQERNKTVKREVPCAHLVLKLNGDDVIIPFMPYTDIGLSDVFNIRKIIRERKSILG